MPAPRHSLAPPPPLLLIFSLQFVYIYIHRVNTISRKAYTLRATLNIYPFVINALFFLSIENRVFWLPPFVTHTLTTCFPPLNSHFVVGCGVASRIYDRSFTIVRAEFQLTPFILKFVQNVSYEDYKISCGLYDLRYKLDDTKYQRHISSIGNFNVKVRNIRH